MSSSPRRSRHRPQRCLPCRREKQQHQKQEQQQHPRFLLEASASLSPKKKKQASSRRATRAPGGRSWAGPCDERTSLLMLFSAEVGEGE